MEYIVASIDSSVGRAPTVPGSGPGSPPPFRERDARRCHAISAEMRGRESVAARQNARTEQRVLEPAFGGTPAERYRALSDTGPGRDPREGTARTRSPRSSASPTASCCHGRSPLGPGRTRTVELARPCVCAPAGARSGKRTPVSSSETSQRRRAMFMSWAAADRPTSFGAPRCSRNPPGPAKLLPGMSATAA